MAITALLVCVLTSSCAACISLSSVLHVLVHSITEHLTLLILYVLCMTILCTGVPGIGPKSAATVLQEHGSLEVYSSCIIRTQS
jgi:hypothetical protein